MSRIVYLSGARLPTEKAHGFQVMKMCEGMAALGHDVELMHPRRHQPDPALAEADPFSYYGIEPTFRVRTIANWDVVRLEHSLPRVALRAAFAAHELAWGAHAARQAVAAQPDLIWTRDPALAYWVSRLGHACAFEAHVSPSRRRAALVRSFAPRPATRAVFGTTRGIAADLQAAGVPPRKIGILPNGVDVAAYEDAPARDEARRRLRLPLGRPIVGYIGRFVTMDDEKGIPDLIRAVAAAPVRRHDPLLLCVGGPMERVPAYMSLASSVGLDPSAVRFVDRVASAEMPTWMAALDAGAMPYPAVAHYVTSMSPMKMFEYMAAGLPIVATDLPAIREVLEDGTNAVLVAPGDPRALAAALAKVLDDPVAARSMGERARQAAAQNTWRDRAERALAAADVERRVDATPVAA